MIAQNKVSGVVLAGGRGRRMGGVDKGLVLFRERPLVHYAIEALTPLVGELFISANRNQRDYSTLGYPVIDDGNADFDGPLAGILAAMRVAKGDWLLIAPCDTPLLTSEHLRRLLVRLRRHDDIGVAFDGERLHPVVMVVSIHLKADLACYLGTGERKLQGWIGRHPHVAVDFSDVASAFANVNSTAELHSLESQRDG